MTDTDREAGNGVETEAEAGASSAADAGSGAHADAAVRADGADLAAPATANVPPRLLLLVGIGLVVVVAVFVSARIKYSATPGEFQDLGAGISNATGLRGSLKTRWQDKTAQYQLKIEPIDPLQSEGFSYVTANPPAPMLLHVKLLDATGFAVCGKDILFPFDAGSPGEQERERGHDVLQSLLGDDGKVAAVTAQGTLPCTAKQYKQIVYWDFSTDFPTLAEQDELMKQPAQLKVRQEMQKRAMRRRQKPQRSAFYTEGDDRVTGYDAQRKMLQTGLGRDFLVTGSAGQSTASVWAANSALFHYKCDQRSRCVLTHAGGTDSLSVFALQ